jgi:hypothetical protein
MTALRRESAAGECIPKAELSTSVPVTGHPGLRFSSIITLGMQDLASPMLAPPEWQSGMIRN